jgi:glycosyltransferase involved in cell wall biosynthesis
MNILFVSSQPYPYGMAGSKRIRLFAEYLSLGNFVKVYITGKNNDRNADVGSKNGVEWEFIKFRTLDHLFRFNKIFSILKKNFKYREKNILMLYNGIGIENILFSIIGKWLNYSIVTDVVEDYNVSEENSSFIQKIRYKINRPIDRHISYFVDGIIVISSRLKAKYLKFKMSNEKLLLVPISAENIHTDLCKRENDTFSFVYSGTFGRKDGVDYLIRAFNSFSIKYPKIKLLLAGKINAEIENIIIDNNEIIYLGLIPDDEYYQFLKDADVLLMPRIDSQYANSGFPFKLGEYLATGNAVIATRISDISNYLEDKKDIILAKPSNHESLVESMEYAINNRERLHLIGESGRLKCMEYFNPEINGGKLEAFLTKF